MPGASDKTGSPESCLRAACPVQMYLCLHNFVDTVDSTQLYGLGSRNTCVPYPARGTRELTADDITRSFNCSNGISCAFNTLHGWSLCPLATTTTLAVRPGNWRDQKESFGMIPCRTLCVDADPSPDSGPVYHSEHLEMHYPQQMHHQTEQQVTKNVPNSARRRAGTGSSGNPRT